MIFIIKRGQNLVLKKIRPCRLTDEVGINPHCLLLKNCMMMAASEFLTVLVIPTRTVHIFAAWIYGKAQATAINIFTLAGLGDTWMHNAMVAASQHRRLKWMIY